MPRARRRVPRGTVVAIDGPAGAGKSTVARATARALGIAHIDTGAMYRALTWLALRRGIDPADGPALGRLARAASIRYTRAGIQIDGHPLGRQIRSRAVGRAVSAVSAHPGVRRSLVRRQRELLGRGAAVVEGRDIGTVVFPRASVKVFLTASAAERARRRHRELSESDRVGIAALRREIERRDRLDSRRAVSPLRPASDAAVIDSTGKTPRRVVAEILDLVDGVPPPPRARRGKGHR